MAIQLLPADGSPSVSARFDYGLEEADMRVRADLELEAVELSIPGEVEIVLSPIAAINLVLKLVGALARLENGKAE